MNIALPRETEEFIMSQVEAGRFASPEQLVQEAVNRLMSEGLEEETVVAIHEGQEQIERGEGMDLDTFKTELRKRTGLKLA